jgi:predicted GNAT family N-acyltransferase
MNLENLTFKQIEYNSQQYWEAVKLRSKVLREPLNMKFTDEQLKAEHSYVHLAAYFNNRLICCLYLITDSHTARLKQFVVEPELQGQGVGKIMMEYMESYCLDHKFTCIFMHAREYAVPFYEKLGYKKYEDEFLEIGLPHWKLRKNLIKDE